MTKRDSHKQTPWHCGLAVWGFALVAALLLTPTSTQAQQNIELNNSATPTLRAQAGDKVYNEDADPMQQIEAALEEARVTGKLVICQVGGNWCPWCIRFAHFIEQDEAIRRVVKENFVYIHLNTSKEHKNLEMLKRLGNPGRFGYPALVVLNREGEVLHIQNSSYLEKEKSYDAKKVLEFFQNWTQKAIETIR